MREDAATLTALQPYGCEIARPLKEHNVNIAEKIRRSIQAGDFVPNQRLVEADLSEAYGASRASIREALVELTSEGLVERIQNRGARVRAVSLAEAIEISEVRMVLESLCAAKVAEHVTDEEIAILRRIGEDMSSAVASGDLEAYSRGNRELHAQVRTLSGQNTASSMIEKLRGQSVRHQYRLAMRPGRATVSLPEHLAIIDAICDHDPERAAAAMRTHLMSVIDELRASVPPIDAGWESDV